MIFSLDFKISMFFLSRPQLNNSQISQGPHELAEAWVICQEKWKNMLILEYGEKIMEDGLATKDRSFLVD